MKEATTQKVSMKKTIEEVLKTGECQVHHPITGDVVFILNPFMLNQQDAWHNLEALKDIHILKQVIYIDLEQETNPKRLKELSLDLQELEFHLQDLWGFSRDARYHRFWEYPKCTCPKLDNEDRYATGFVIVNSDCPLHGREPAFVEHNFDVTIGSGTDQENL
jgi:hypothetical protein